MPDARKVLGYGVRQPFDSEREFFRQNPQVAGMAAEDNRIVLNPYSPLSPRELDAVAVNEASRLWIRDHQPDLRFDLTDEQKQNLAGTMYGEPGMERAAKETVIGRILSNDPSVGTPTSEQLIAAEEIRASMTSAQREKPEEKRSRMPAFADGAFQPGDIGATLGALQPGPLGAPLVGIGEGPPSLPVGEALGAVAPAAAAPMVGPPVLGPPIPGLEIDTTRAPAARGTAFPTWAEIESQPGFQNLSAHGKRQIRAQYLAEVEKIAAQLYKKPKDREEFMQGALPLIGDYKDPTRTTMDWLNDFNIAIQKGVAGVTGGLGETALGIGQALGITDATRSFTGDPASLANLFNPAAQNALREQWDKETSAASQDFQKYKAEREAKARAEGGGEWAAGKAVGGAFLERPSQIILGLTEQVPNVLAIAGPAGLARGAVAGLSRIGQAANLLREGKLTAETAKAALAASEAAGTRAGQVVGAGLGSALVSADARNTFIEQLVKVPDAAWMTDPEFAAAVAAGEDKKKAKERIARDRSDWAAGVGAVLGVFSGISGFERLFIGPAIEGMKRRALSALAEPVTELAEELVPMGQANFKAQGLDPTIKWSAGMGPAAAEVLAVTGPFGVAAGAFPGRPAAAEPGVTPPAVTPGEAPPGPPAGPAAAVAAPAPEMPSAIAMAQTALTEARTAVQTAQAVIDNPASTPEQITEAQKTVAEQHSRANGLETFIDRWNNVPATKDVQRNIQRDERRIADLEANQLADPDAKAREIAALQGRIESNRQLEALGTFDENQLNAFIDSRNESLAAASTERGLGITVDKARLTNEIAHAQRLLEERAEIETPADVEFKQRAPKVFDRDPGGVPIWPDTNEVHNLPFMESINVQRDKALSLVNLVKGNPQFTRSQRTTAITRARGAWETANRVASAWNLPDEDLNRREDELVQTIGAGLTGATGFNPGHFAELAGVLAAKAERAGNPMTYRQAQNAAMARIGAIYQTPGAIGPSVTSIPDNPAPDNQATAFYDDKPTQSGSVVLAQTPTDDEKKAWNSIVNALVKAGFPKKALEALSIRIATTNHPRALGLYIPSSSAKFGANLPFTLAVNWTKHAAGDAKSRQWTGVHEISHALADSMRNGTDLSAVDARFQQGGDFRTEIEAAFNKGKGVLDKYYYPLDPSFGYGNEDTAAELWAQSTAYYFLDRNLLKQHAPKTFAFVEKFYADLAAAQFTNRQQLGAEVQRLFSGVPPAGVAPTAPGGPAAPGAGPVAGPAGPQAPPGGAAGPAGGGVGANPLLNAAQTAVANAAARATSMLSADRAAEAQGRLVADAIATVEAQLAQERAAESARGEVARPVEPARGPQGVPGPAQGAAVEPAARRGEAAEGPAPAAERPVRPAARGVAEVEGASKAAQAAVAEGERALAQEPIPPLTIREGTVTQARAVRRIRSAIEEARRKEESIRYNIRRWLKRIKTGRIRVADEFGNRTWQALEEADLDQIRELILEQANALTAQKVEVGRLLDELAKRNFLGKAVPNPTSISRMQNLLGRLLGIPANEVMRRLPRIHFITEADVQPDGTVRLRDGRKARPSGNTAAFYAPENNALVFNIDRLPQGMELGIIVHELFHKRGGQLLGAKEMQRLRDEVLGWKDYPKGSPERKIYDKAMRRVADAAQGQQGAERADTVQEELLPYFITEAFDQGHVPDVRNILQPGVAGLLARFQRYVMNALRTALGREIPPGKLGVNELMTAAWGAAQYELDSQQYEDIAAGNPVNPEMPGDARARLALASNALFERRLAEMKKGENLYIPELSTPEERARGMRPAEVSNSRQVAALSAAPKEMVVRAATATPAVGPTDPQFSIRERFDPKEAKPILTTDELEEYLRTGNRPTVSWMQQQRDRQVENYIDHQRPFLSWLKRHALPLKAWAELKLIPGRLKVRGEAYQRELLAPLERGIAKLAKDANIPVDRAALDVGWWATLRHIPEANAALRQKFQARIIAGERGAAEDLRNHDLAQRGQGPGPLAGGLSDTKAAANMAALENRYTPEQVAEIKRMGDEIVAAFAKLKDDAVASGQISRDALRQFPNFKHYVALTGPNQGDWDNQISDSFGSFISENRLREREGRTSSVANSSVEALAERIGRVAAYDASRDFKQELNAIYENAGGENNTIGLERFTANLVQTPTKSDIVWNSPEGKRYVFRFKEGASIGESLLGKNREYHDTIGLKAMDYITRKFSRAVTQWIIAFGPVNAIRDIQEKAILIRSRDVKDANGNPIDVNEVFKRTWKYWLNPDTWRAARQLAFEKGKRADESTQIGRYSNELVTEGGVSTWGEQTRKGLDSIEAAVREEGRRAGLGRGDQNTRQRVEDFVRNYNLMFEIMSSLSVNAAMRDLGVAKKDAAFQTLDLMNFQNVGARSGWLRAAFSFFNPAAQSGYNLYRQVIQSKRGRRDFFALLAFSFFLQGLLRSLADDDEELGNELDQKGTWEVERNIPVKVLGVPLKIPVGFGAPQFAWAITNSGYRWASGRYDTADAVVQSGIAVLKSFNPIPISEIGPTKQPISFLLKTFTPTVFRPAVDFMTDSDAWGGKLTAYYPDKTKFRAEQGRPTTAVLYKDLARGFKDIGFDMYPEQVKALAEGIAWGPFGYILQGVADWNKENEGRRLNPMDQLPASAFLRFMGTSRFIGGESRYLEARYYENYDKALNDLREFNEAKAHGQEAQWRASHPERSRRVAALQDQERVMRGLSKDFNSTVKALQNETMDFARGRPALERIQNQREAAMRKFLKNVHAWQENEDDEP